jgi:hypothetical protein
MCNPLSSTEPDFQTFCDSVREWLRAAPRLDVSLAAAADLLDRRDWFECEVNRLVANATDIHAALGASVLLGLWKVVANAPLPDR